MRLAIMQPYFLPYLGYWQLMAAADRFVIYDNVNYIKGGWINRNRILIGGSPGYITVPLQQASPYKQICEIEVQAGAFWRDKMAKTLEVTYRRSPCFAEVFPVLESVIRCDEQNLADYLALQLTTLASFLGLRTTFVRASATHPDRQHSGQERVLDICKREGASQYVNAEGGMILYEPAAFQDRGVELQFLVMHPTPYPQRSTPFTPYLSIVDALMEVGRAGIGPLLQSHEIVRGAAIPAESH